MKDKKKLIVALGEISLAVLLVLLIVILGNKMKATAEYSDEYNRIFGEFAAKTTSELLEKEENTCYSPISLFATMALLSEITEGQTRQELLSCLGVNDIGNLEDIYSRMEKSVVMLEKDIEDKDGKHNSKYTAVDQSGPSVITLCNSLWIEKEVLDDNSDEIIEMCKEKLNCEIFECERLSKREIDGWVAEKTKNLINDIASGNEDDIALINTLYYKSSWYEKFNTNSNRSFYLEDGECIKVDFLYCSEAELNFIECNDYTMVKFPLKHGDMILVLPAERKKLDKLITYKKINEIISIGSSEKMQEGLVDASFPMFEITDSFGNNIKDTLEKLGVKNIYDTNCDWKISGKLNGVSVDIEQSSKIIVNENGIEAATATKAAAYISAKKDIDLAITFNRPFLYILMKDGVPLFIGTVYNPAE